MRYKVELEFVVDGNFIDDEGIETINNGETTEESMADYALRNNLSKYEDIVCDVIGFPGYFDVKKIEKNDEN